MADTEEEAARLSLPFQHMMARLRTNAEPTALPTVEESETLPLPLAPADFAALRDTWFAGTAEAVAERLLAFAAEHGVDEVMVQPVAGAYAADPADRTITRQRALTELAAAIAARD